ncbi:GGDEF domain-containing protein [Methylobacterium frigidaeris]|nr:GGDEF domain-containing protein [Methylobacterium frigidaeris]
MTLDVPTLLFAGVTARCCYVVVFLVSGLRLRDEPCLLHWSGSVACSIIGTLIHYGDGGSGRTLTPFEGAVAHAFFGGSLALCWSGMRRFHRLPIDLRGATLAAVLPGLAFAVPLQLGFGRSGALTGAFAVLIVLIVATLRELARNRSRGAEWSRYVAASGLSVYLAAFATSVALFLAGREVGDDAQSANAALLIDHACSVLIYVGFLAMAGERCNARLTELATTDPLTGLTNRRGVFQAIEQGRMRPAAVLLADIDNFKAINDGSGHEAGDAVLAEFAARLRHVAGPRALPARWGGEEFLLLLPPRLAGAGADLAERIRAATEAEPFRAGGAPLRVTVSIGIAAGGGDLGALLRRADGALYAAKRGGRNRTCAAPETVAGAVAEPAAA